jgi:hypothetical protein
MLAIDFSHPQSALPISIPDGLLRRYHARGKILQRSGEGTEPSFVVRTRIGVIPVGGLRIAEYLRR